LVALVPPKVLQSAPELVRLLDATDFLAPRELRFGRELLDETAQRFLQAVGESLVVRAEGWIGCIAPSIFAPSFGRASGHGPEASGCPYVAVRQRFGRIQGAFDGDDRCVGKRKFHLSGHAYLAVRAIWKSGAGTPACASSCC
jgi:hypothetical protein